VRNPPLVYVDTNVYIDLITRNEDLHPQTGDPRWAVAKKLFDAASDDKIRIATSSLTEAEVIVNGDTRQRATRSEKVRKLLGDWFKSPGTSWIDIDRFVVRIADQVVEECRSKKHSRDKPFPTADALHMAAAIRLRCDYLMTYDYGFPIGHKIQGVAVAFPQVIWQEELFD
jgi:predicted nucleic acid-binding protein